MIAIGFILATVCVTLSIYSTIVDRYVTQLMISDCTTQMVTPPLRGVCCRSVCQAYGEQLVTTALAAHLMEELLVDNLDIVEAKLVSV